MNADFEKLGREALEDGTPESENLAKAVSAGAFTMNEFLTVLRKTPKAMMPADKRKETEDSIRLLEAMTEVQRKNNVLLNHKVMAVLGPQLAKKAGVPGDTPSRVSLHFQVTETIMRCVRKWKENGESIPTTMEGLQQKALADGSLNHLLKGMKRFQ